MTHRAAGSFRGVPRIWILPLIVITGVLGAIVLDILSRSLLLDLVAWWPVWLLLLITVFVARGRRVGRVRVSGLVSILVSVILVVFVVGHVRGWPLNPSASRYLAGPPVGAFAEGSMAATIQGDLVVAGGSQFLYEVLPLPGGGDLGMPIAEERVVEDTVAVTLEPPADPGLDTSSGWDVRLSERPVWELTIGGVVEADLTALQIRELGLEGGGEVALGLPGSRVPVSIAGGYTISVPVDAPVEVLGSAQVPDSWEGIDGGWRSPVGGEGWVITVPEGSVVSLVER